MTTEALRSTSVHAEAGRLRVSSWALVVGLGVVIYTVVLSLESEVAGEIYVIAGRG
jgi:uncharacterized membrane protein YozB (DUF420 family)